ncbi:MAG: cobalamin-dependent protein, partial [Candidatus Krumholzibacteria bacterium]|nr:cobalamin-dependent protein [Candidatus Krumholzibacteria bacterium]
MRVLLISSNSLKPSPQLPWVPVEPLGPAYVAAGLRAAGRDVEFLDLCFVEDRRAAVREAIARSRPDVVGISLRNVDLMAYFNPLSFVGELEDIVDECRRRSAAPVILGGSGFSVMPGELLRFTGADAGIAGEGEWSFPRLLDRIERGEGYADVPGVVLPSAGERGFEMAGAAFESLDRGMRPARDLVDGARYRAAGGSASIQTKRGCPFGCIYCTYPIVEGAAVRCRPPGEVAEEFRELFDRHGVRNAYVVDNQFNYPPSHAAEVCERLIAKRDEC